MADSPPRDSDTGRRPRAGAAHAVRGKRATRAAMMLLTGASATLWIMVQVDDGMAGRDWIWLLIIVNLTAWPSYLAWCSHRRLSSRLDEVEERGLAAYGTGYADGYIDALAGGTLTP